jgi:dolichol-phosphate mannosyltransferase
MTGLTRGSGSEGGIVGGGTNGSLGGRWRILALVVIAFAFLLRLLSLGQVELIPEETYYWLYSRHLDIGYLDHPPMVAWLIHFGTAVFGEAEFGVRIGALCCAAVASFFVYRLTRNLFGEPSALVAVVLMQVLPFFFLTGLLITPDAPLTATWAAALYFLERALIAGRSIAWLAAGVAIGLGLISKYTIGMLVPAMVLFALIDPASRRWLLRWEPYVALALAAAIFAPVIIWNATHEWASFAFQTSRRLAEAPKFSLHKLIISALVLLTPTGFVSLAFSPLTRGLRTIAAADARRWRFVQVAVFVPLAVFVAFSLRHDVKIDWTGALWLAAVPALGFAITSFGRRGIDGVRGVGRTGGVGGAPGPVGASGVAGSRGLPGWLRAAWVPTVVVFLGLYAVGLVYLARGLPGVAYSNHMELVPVGWRDLGRQVVAAAAEIRRTSGEDPLIVGMDRYSIASELTFYAPDHTRSVQQTSSGHLFGQAGLMYERWFPPAQQEGRTLLLVGWTPEDLRDSLVAPRVRKLEPIQEGILTRGDTVIRYYFYRIAYGFRSGGVADHSGPVAGARAADETALNTGGGPRSIRP